MLALFWLILEKSYRLKSFQRALTIDDTNGAIYYNLANIYYNQGRFNEAIKLYQNH